ncbi:MAG: mRNA-decapping enzyme subunit 2 [Pycnora praestabilis]|nr:MAG: mRNA-decapping enzyme subunit 2 [Pycnora praestabilis]
MLNDGMDKAVLVKGWKKGANWSFPRGKINKDERDLDCAVREVYEETGFDIAAAGLVQEESAMKYIEVTMREQHMRLYVFRGVPTDTHFEPRTRKEISKIQWYKLSELPTFRKSKQQQEGCGEDLAINANKFYMVAPFLVPLKKWIAQQHKHDGLKVSDSQHLALPNQIEEPLTEEEVFTETEVEPTLYRDADRLIAHLRQSGQTQDQRPPPELSAVDKPLQNPTARLKDLLTLPVISQQLDGTSTKADQPDSKSNALLALLRNGNSSSTGLVNEVNAPLQTPIEQVHPLPSMPNPPQHPHPRPPQFSRLPPPPSFPFLLSGPNKMPQRNNSGHRSQHFGSISSYAQRGHYQHHGPRGLSTPQQSVGNIPAPQRQTFFIGSPNHGPVITSQPQAARAAQEPPRPYQRTGDPQFANVHAPAIPPASKVPPSKLNSHTLALLDVFKGSDPSRPTTVHEQPSSEKSIDPSSEKMMQSLPASQLSFSNGSIKPVDIVHAPKRLQSTAVPHINEPTRVDENLLKPAGVLPSTDTASRSQHQARLLNLFRKPPTPLPEIGKGLDSTTVVSPGPVELSAQRSPAPVNRDMQRQEPIQVPPIAEPERPKPTIEAQVAPLVQKKPAAKEPTSATILGPLNAPSFEAVARNGRHTVETNGNQQKYATARRHAKPVSVLSRSAPSQAPQKVEPAALIRSESSPRRAVQRSESPRASKPVSKKPFQPQILRRPAQPQEQALRNAPASIPGPLFTENDPAPLDEHKQSLLASFSKPAVPSPVPPASPSEVVNPMFVGLPQLDTTAALASRSRIGSLASMAGTFSPGARVPSGARTPPTPVDKSFLLGYLEGVAKARRYYSSSPKSNAQASLLPPPPPPSGAAKLTSRRLLALHGQDAPHFLQGITTNNIRSGQTSGIYSAFLNAQGRVLNDVFIYPTTHSSFYTSTLPSTPSLSGSDPAYIIEVDAAEAPRLLAHIKKYKLRAKFQIRLMEEAEWDTWSIWDATEKWTPHPSPSSPSTDTTTIGCLDTRAPTMGRRLLLPSTEPSPASSEIPETTLAAYTIRRMLRGVPEGQVEIIREHALPLESNIDVMGGVDFRKGCYVGQELTIRTKHTGVVRKRILPVLLYPSAGEGAGGVEEAQGLKTLVYDAKSTVPVPPSATNISRVNARGRSAGRWVNGVGNVGLALCRLEIMTDLGLTGEGSSWKPEHEFKMVWESSEREGEGAGRVAGEVQVKAFVPGWMRTSIGVRDTKEKAS